MSTPRADAAGSHDSDGEGRGRSSDGEEPRRDGAPAGSSADTLSIDEKPGDATTSATGSELLDTIDRLKKQQRDLKAAKKRLSTELRNAEKRRGRLRKKAKQLSDQDLLDVLKMRASGASSSSEAPGSAAVDALHAGVGGGAGSEQSAKGAFSKKYKSAAK